MNIEFPPIRGNKIQRDIDTTTRHTLLHVALKLKKLLFVKRLLELNADPTIAYSKNGTVMTSENDGYTGGRLYGDSSPQIIKKDIAPDKFAANHIQLLALLKVYGLVISTDTMNVKVREEFDMYCVLFLEEKNRRLVLQSENDKLKSKLTDLDKVYQWKQKEQSVITIQSIFKKVGAKRKLEELKEAAAKEKLKDKAIKVIYQLLKDGNYYQAKYLTEILANENYELLKEKIEENIDFDLPDSGPSSPVKKN